MDTNMSPTEEHRKSKRLRPGVLDEGLVVVAATAAVYHPEEKTRHCDCSNCIIILPIGMRRKGKLVQMVNKCNKEKINDKAKLILLIQPQDQIPRKYFLPIMFPLFACALLDFHAHKFPTKPEKLG